MKVLADDRWESWRSPRPWAWSRPRTGRLGSPTRHRGEQPRVPHRRGNPTSGPSPTCSPRSSRRTTRRTPRPSATCSRRTPRSRTRTARSRGAATPSSSVSRGSSRRTTAARSPWTPTPSGSSGPTSRSRRARRRSRPGPTPRRVTNRYSVIYARQGGRWLHARIRDEPSEEATPHERLLELEWMLGEWVNESDDGVVSHHLHVGGGRQLPAPRVRRQGRGPHRPQRHPAHRLGRPAGAVPHVGLRRRRRVRRGADVTRRRPLGRPRRGRPVGRAVGLVHQRDHGPRQGPDSLGESDRTVGGEAIPDTDRFTLVRRRAGPGK